MKKLFILAFLLLIGGGVANAQGQFVSGAITTADNGTECATTNGFVSIGTGGGSSASVAFSVSGTFSATLQFVTTVDGTNYVTVNAYPPNSTTAVTSTTGAGTWTVSIPAQASFCVRASAYTSGSAIINMRNSTAVSVSTLTGGGGGGSSGLSGMTAGQVPIAATATTVTSSEALAGSGAAITTGPASSTSTDFAAFTGTGGQIADSGIPDTAIVCTSFPAPGAYTPAGTASSVECLRPGTYTLPTSVTTISNNNSVIFCMNKAAIIARGSGASGILFSGNQSGIRGCTLDDGAFTSTASFVAMSGTDDFITDYIHQNSGSATSAFATVNFVVSATRPTATYGTFLGTQFDPCIAVNEAGTGSGTITDPAIQFNRVVSFLPGAAGICIWVNQANGSTILRAKITDNWVYGGGNFSNLSLYNVQQQVAPTDTSVGLIFERNHAIATVLGVQLFKIFGAFYCRIAGNIGDDGGLALANPTFLFGDIYRCSIDGNVSNGLHGAVGGLICTDCTQDSFTGNIINGTVSSKVAFNLNATANPSQYDTITGNTVVLGSGAATCYQLQAASAQTVRDNVFTGNSCVGTSTASQVGMSFLDTSGTFSDNVAYGNFFALLPTGITIGAGATNTEIGQTHFDTVTTPVSDSGTTSHIVTHTILGSIALVSGTPSTATVTGISPVFTATGDYVCTVSGQSGAATDLLSVANVSTSSFTITGPATDTRVVNYICAGF